MGRLEAINCIKESDGRFYGTNTDYLACLEILLNYFQKKIQFFILGDGAMSNVLQVIFNDHKENVKVLSRKKGNLFNFNFSKNKNKYFIINTCHKSYLFDGTINDQLILFWDLNYNVNIQESSPLIKNEKYLGGLNLLYLQAKYALNFWDIK